jgi:hypothetical protein
MRDSFLVDHDNRYTGGKQFCSALTNIRQKHRLRLLFMIEAARTRMRR